MQKEKTILFLHGFYASGQCVPAVALREAFEGKANVLTPDLPLHPHDAIRLIREICDKEKPDVLVGNSCGSRRLSASLPYSATRTSRCQTSSVNVSAAINTSHQGLTASRTSPLANTSSASSRNWRHISSTAVIYIIRIACGDSSVRKIHWHTSSRFS